MPDYGQELRFGAFITPSNQPDADPVRLAVLAEELGLELVTFQDHPYQPGYFDTWTLLTWVAARTERIGLAGNVLNLPLRQPAVLARSLAGLDILSGGRVNLGIGAGTFWHAVEAMGGPVRTAGESVDALTEALEIFRQIWDVDAPGGVRVEGKHYRVVGAKRGPAPAHRIPTWIGAYGPRMLRLTGRLADGWLPTQSYLKDGDLARGNAIIDAAARKAGRDPAQITRLLNIDPRTSVAELTAMAVGDGISTFLVWADDADTMTTFARRTAPAVRDAVASARRG